MSVSSIHQNKTEAHQMTPYTQQSHPSLVAPDRSHGQIQSIGVSWITENSLLLIPSLGHDNKDPSRFPH